MTELPRPIRWVFRRLLRRLPAHEDELLAPRILAGLERGWRERRANGGLGSALRFVVREWLDLVRNVVMSGGGVMSGGKETGMRELWFDVRTAVRGLARSPALVAGTVLTLGIGIGANLALFSLLHGVLLRPLPYGEPDQLVAVYTDWEGNRELGLPWAEIGDLHRESETLDAVAGALIPGMDTRFLLETVEGREPVEALRASPNFFRVLGVDPALGTGARYTGPLEEISPSALLTDEAWRARWGGDPAVVGTTIRVTGVEYQVAGVLPGTFAFQLGARSPELFLLRTPSTLEREDRGNPIVQPIARVRTGATLDDVAAELERMAPALEAARPADAPDLRLHARTLRDQLVGDTGGAIIALMAAAALVLLVACANLAALFLARHSERETDQALRAALGAGRRRLLRLPLIESVLLGIGGAALGLGLAGVATEVVLGMVPEPIFRYEGMELGPTVVAAGLALALITGVLFGGLPAWRAGRTRPAEALRRGGTRGASAGTRAIRLLAGLEAAALVVLLVATGLSLRSLDALLRVDLGFESEGRVTATFILPEGRYEGDAFGTVINRIEERLEALPDIDAVGTVTHLPLDTEHWGGSLAVEGEDAESTAPTDWELASPGYFEAAGIELLRGRSFSRDDGASTPRVTVVSRTLARMIRPVGPLEDVLGLRISGTGPEGPWMEVVGIVDDIRQRRIGGEPRPHMYVSHAQMFPVPERELVIATTGADPLAALQSAIPVLQEIEPEIVVAGPRTMDQLVRRALGTPRVVSVLLGLFGSASLLLALTGIYGITAFAVARRKREIGIRACLGAGRRALFVRAMAEAVVPVGVGAAVGVGLVVAVAPRAESLIYGVDPLDPTTILTVSATLLAAAAATAWMPARRAARLDPVEVLGEG